MTQDSLENFGAYRKAIELFDLVVTDMKILKREPMCGRLIVQQVASADSISSNIEEGHGRGTRKEYAQYLRISRGSARETRGRYQRMKHWLPELTTRARTALCDEIIGILTKTINSLGRIEP
jgi:four helix bundle protein